MHTAAVVTLAVVLLAVPVTMQLAVRRRAQAMTGTRLPALPTETGARIAGASRALVYFFSPSCGACVRITPRLRALSARNASVFVVDVFEEMALAKALGVMGTPSFVEIADGIVVGYHVGQAPPELLARFT